MFTLILVAGLSVFAEVKPMMQEFFNLTNQVSPYLIDKAMFMSEKNDKEISKVLADFVQNTKNGN